MELLISFAVAVIAIFAAIYLKSQGLTKSASDKVVVGVCAGIARHYNLSATGVRILAVLFVLITGGLALITYICLAAILQEK